MAPHSIYFLLRPLGDPEHSGYQHCIIALAEGLQSLAIPFFSNIDYWQTKDGHLFCSNRNVDPADCDVLVSSNEYEGVGNMPDALFRGGRRTVYLDTSDGWRTRCESSAYRRYDIILRTHLNAHYSYPKNIYPWAFGLTQRMIDACENPLPFEKRKQRVLVNFRVSHAVRRVAEKKVLPGLKERFEIDRSVDDAPAPDSGVERLLWEATGRRHSGSFYARLKSSMICAAFGGQFSPGIFRRTENLAERVLNNAVWQMGRTTGTIMQFDSWRFWESMAAGCLTLQADYERFGCCLPVMPQNGIHYAGIDLLARDSTQSLRDSSLQDLAKIAEAGRAWALEHYSPAAVARRLMSLLSSD
jgi:hypothetical protein